MLYTVQSSILSIKSAKQRGKTNDKQSGWKKRRRDDIFPDLSLLLSLIFCLCEFIKRMRLLYSIVDEGENWRYGDGNKIKGMLCCTTFSMAGKWHFEVMDIMRNNYNGTYFWLLPSLQYISLSHSFSFECLAASLLKLEYSKIWIHIGECF